MKNSTDQYFFILRTGPRFVIVDQIDQVSKVDKKN